MNVPSPSLAMGAALVVILAFAAAPAGAAQDAADNPAAKAAPLKVKAMFHWKAQAQWSGYYMAREKGFYAKRGLDVELLPRQGRSDALDPLLDGRVQFATHFLASGMGVRGLRQPVVLIGQMFNRSNLMIVARKSAGVERMADLSGKNIAYWDGYYSFIFRALFRAQGVKDYVERPMGLQVLQFTSKQVDACSAMEYNEYNLIRSAPGVDPDDLQVFLLRDMGMDYPEDAIFTTEEFARDNPQACRDFVAATLEGWRFARDNPEETLKVVAREIANDPDVLVTPEHSAWMLRVCAESVFPPEGSNRSPGVLDREDFEAVRVFLRESDQLRHDVRYEDFARLDAVEAPDAPAKER